MAKSCAVLIDVGYLDKVLKYCYDEQRIDYSKLAEVITDGDRIMRKCAYDALLEVPSTTEEVEKTGRKQKFHRAIERSPGDFEIRLGKLVRLDDEYGQKGVDVLIAIDLVEMALMKTIEKVVIVAGDWDLSPAIEVAKREGLEIVLYHKNCLDEKGNYKTKADNDLLMLCDAHHEIDESIMEQIKL